MKSILLFLLSLLPCFALAESQDYMTQLDNLIKESKKYDRAKEKTIARLRQNYASHRYLPTAPSRLCRTWPNLMSGEGFRGQEYNSWSTDGGNPPYHVCVLPFTRGLAGPMDFTPGIFNFHNKAVPTTHPQTTLVKQLAEYIVLFAPWQMAADEIENYEGQPGFSWIETVPTNWEKTVVVNAKIGNYLTIARRDRNSENWYLGSVTDEKPRNLDITLDFLDDGAGYMAEIYSDGEGTDYRTNPYPLAYTRQLVHKGDKLTLRLAPSGGAAIRFLKQQ